MAIKIVSLNCARIRPLLTNLVTYSNAYDIVLKFKMVLFSGVTSLNNIKAIYLLPKPVEHLFGVALATPVWFLDTTIHRYVCTVVSKKG